MSGKESFSILEKIFQPKNKTKQIKGNTIKYGHIVDNQEIVDEVLVSYFKAPKSYTTEDMCEINSHGGNVIVKRILEICLKNGAELAEARRIYQKSLPKRKNRPKPSRSSNRRNQRKIKQRSKNRNQTTRRHAIQKNQ